MPEPTPANLAFNIAAGEVLQPQAVIELHASRPVARGRPRGRSLWPAVAPLFRSRSSYASAGASPSCEQKGWTQVGTC